MSRTKRLTILLTLVCLTSCSWLPFFGEKNPENEYQASSEQVLYDSAQRSLRAGNYLTGIAKLEALESRFPFGSFAQQAQLELIYAYYQNFNFESAETAADRFIRLHPNHPNIDYALYMRGLTIYAKDHGFFDRFLSQDASKRDTVNVRSAFNDFSALTREFPNSEYAMDARQRMIFLRNLIAQSEVNVANYYISLSANVAAANRARGVIENYSQTPAVAEALAILIEANYRLGLKDAANDALRILSINYPRYPSFDANGNFVFEETIRNRDRSWLNIMTLGLLGRPEIPPPIQIKHPDGFTPPETKEKPTEPKKTWYQHLSPLS